MDSPTPVDNPSDVTPAVPEVPDVKPTSLLDDPSEPQVTTQADWPDDWRSKLTDDDKALKRLERFSNPKDVWKSYTELEKKLKGGEYKKVLPQDADEAMVTQWRKENGIPETPEDYHKHLDGLVIGEEDKPIADQFLGYAHENNLDPSTVKGVMDWFYQNRADQFTAQEEKDHTLMTETKQSLIEEYGNEYMRNINAVNGMLDAYGLKDLANARLMDGTPVFNQPDFVKAFVNLAKELNPAATVVPGSGVNALDSIEDEIKQIETTMQNNRSQYNADQKMQARYSELLTAREKISSRK